jgi:hypothetical protein
MKIKYLLLATLSAICLNLPLRADTLTTTFVGGNQFTGNMFDLTVGSNAIDVTDAFINLSAGTATIDIYIKLGSYTTAETNAAAWTLVSATSVTSTGSGLGTDIDASSFLLSADTTYGVYVTVDTNNNAAPYIQYNNIAGDTTVTGTDLSLTAGIGEGGKFGSLAVIDNREWNGTLDYTQVGNVAPTPEPGSLLLSLTGLSGVLATCRKRWKKS